MARIIAFLGAADDKVWINPDFVMRVASSGTGYVSVYLADGGSLSLKGEADEVVSKLNARLDP